VEEKLLKSMQAMLNKEGSFDFRPLFFFEWRREYIKLCHIILPNKIEYETSLIDLETFLKI
jgi:sugar/nucleoside kinase (ribokinase family)